MVSPTIPESPAVDSWSVVLETSNDPTGNQIDCGKSKLKIDVALGCGQSQQLYVEKWSAITSSARKSSRSRSKLCISFMSKMVLGEMTFLARGQRFIWARIIIF